MSLIRALPALIGLVLPLLVSSTVTASAETVTQKSIRYYTVSGRTAAEIDRELSKHGPMTRTTGSRHPGLTEIKFGGEISYAQDDGRCRVKAVKVTVSTAITLPRWKNRNKASREMGLLWDTLSADIKRHEERHAEIARNHARTLDARLSGLRPTRDCETLQKQAAALSERTSQEHDADQARFDQVEAINFERRMTRLIRARTAAQSR